MRVLVTGATGFVGSHLVEGLLQGGHEVRVLARQTSDQRWMRGLPVTWCWGDVRDANSLRPAVEEAEWVFHVAGVTKAPGYRAYMAANAAGTAHVMEACVGGSPPKKVVLVSSLAASGPCSTARPRLEDDPCEPVSHYGMSKLEGERIALSYADRIPLLVIRPPAVYGPRDRDFLAPFRLIQRGWDLTVGRRDLNLCLIHVRDLVKGIIRGAEAGVASGSIFFLSDGALHVWSEVVRVLARIMGVRVRTIRLPMPVAWVAAFFSETACALQGVPPLFNRQKVREMIQEAWTCDIRRASQELGFHPEIPLEEGLRETYLWYTQHGWI